MSSRPSHRAVPQEYADIDIENNAQRLPLVLCLDTSKSMDGPPIQALNQALREWAQELHNDVNLNFSVDVAIITFGGNGVLTWRGADQLAPRSPVSPFVAAHEFRPPVLQAGGVTLMTEALELAVHIVNARKAELRAMGLGYSRPQICLVTDGLPTDPRGYPTDAWQRLVPMLGDEQAARRFRLFAIGVGGISDRGEEVLRAFAPKLFLRLDGFPFREVLQLMSASANAEQKGAGDEIAEKLVAKFRTQRPAGGR